MNKIQQAILAAFPNFDAAKLNDSLKLGEIDGWDSMSAVNFAIELETSFNVKLGDEVFRADQTIREVLTLLASRGAHI